jgi:hypothetical protein
MHYLLWLMVLFVLSACTAPPQDDGNTRKAPVVTPKAKSGVLLPDEVKPLPKEPLPKGGGLLSLPADWTVIDPKSLLEKVEYKPSAGGVLLTLHKNASLELISAEDAEHHSYYKGRLNDAHVVALPASGTSILVVFSNRQNARSSVLLKYR